MYYIGVDLGGTNIAVGVTDENGTILCKDSVKTLRDRSFEEISDDIGNLCVGVLAKARINSEEVNSIGIGTPGACDYNKGVLIYASTFKFKNADFKKALQRFINVPVYIENDGNAAALAECMAGGAKGAKNVIMITLGTGIGGGIIIDGCIYRGFNNVAGELGHTVIVCGGQQCLCGRKGCFEMYASATALTRMTREYVSNNPDSYISSICEGKADNISARTAFSAARNGDKAGIELVEIYEEYLAEGLSNMINIFEPEVLIMGGGVCKEGEYLLAPIRQKIIEKVYT
ncbi:MAG TPA: ROK family protein, partial [Clostridia bacterium]|nr:ROK family protein [Clostridia bacterium]